MNFRRLQDLLHAARQFEISRPEPNIFSIGGRGYYENPTSDILAFYLDPDGAHGLGDLLLSSLIECLPERPALLGLEQPPLREYGTEGQNRIDILLVSTPWVIVIENKIRHWLANDLNEYRETVRVRFANKHAYFIVLAPERVGVPEDWHFVSYRQIIPILRAKLGERIVKSGMSKWGLFFREFLLHLESQLGTNMDDEKVKFIGEHYQEVITLIDFHNEYINHVKGLVAEIAKQALGTDTPIVGQESWHDTGVALHVYLSEKRKHNVVLLLLRNGYIRVQFYVQVDSRNPKNAERDVFSANGQYDYKGTEGRGSLWLFFHNRDHRKLDDALRIFQEVLQLLRRNTD